MWHVVIHMWRVVMWQVVEASCYVVSCYVRSCVVASDDVARCYVANCKGTHILRGLAVGWLLLQFWMVFDFISSFHIKNRC
jgi:hypothetical protein